MIGISVQLLAIVALLFIIAGKLDRIYASLKHLSPPPKEKP